MAKERTGVAPGERKFTVTVSSPGGCKRVLSIEIPKEELEQEEELVLAELRKDLRVPGFRKGKVPIKYIEKNYREVIHNDAVQNLLPRVYEDALVRENITPMGEPKFENVNTKEGENITMDVVVEVRPEITVAGYRDIKVKVEKKAVEESSVDDALSNLRERMTTLKVVDRDVREGDFVLVDYGPLLDSGEVDAKSMARNYPVDLSGESLLKEFREGLVGMGMNDEKDIPVNYPDDFPEKEMAGSTKTFRVSVKEIKEREIPELDDDFAKQVGQFDDMAALRRNIEEDLVKEEERRQLHDAEEGIIDQLIEKNRFDVPEAMVENYLSSVLEEDKKRRPTVPDEGEREREVREHFRDAAVRTIKKYFILEAVKKQEGIEVVEGEIDAKVDELAQGERAEEIRQYLVHPERRRNIRNELLDQKVLKFLRESADIKSA